MMKGFTAESARAMVAPMETALDELVRLLKAPQPSLRDRYGLFVLKFAGNLATGVAIGLGIGVGLALAG